MIFLGSNLVKFILFFTRAIIKIYFISYNPVKEIDFDGLSWTTELRNNKYKGTFLKFELIDIFRFSKLSTGVCKQYIEY